MTHKELKNRALKKASVLKEYNALETEFSLLKQMLRVRKQLGVSQAQIAERMKTKAPAITRLESSLSSGKHSPSLETIKKYAEALGCHIEINIVSNQPV